MKRRSRCRPAVERLEDRALPGDTLGALLGIGLWPDPPAAGAAPSGDPSAARRADARGLDLAGGRRPSHPDPLPGSEAVVWVGRTETVKPLAADSHRHSTPPEGGDHWLDRLMARPARGRPSVLADGAAAGGGAVSADGQAPDGHAHHGGDHSHHGADDHTPDGVVIPSRAVRGPGSQQSSRDDHTPNGVVTLSRAARGPVLQSPRELAEIAFFTAEYARYEASHPHGHDGDPGHHHDDPPAGPVPPGDEVGGQSSSFGQWGPVLSLPLTTVHSHQLPTGKVLLWAYSQDPRRIWDPATGQIEARIPAAPGYNIFCVGHAYLADGRLFVAGGHVENGWGLPNASIYDPVADTWTNLPDMNAGRWYPTATTLPNGDVLVTSGSMDTDYTNNTLPQVYQAATNTWRNLTAARLTLPLYPFMFVAPNGRAFSAGPQQMSRYLDTTGTGAWANVANNTFGYRDYGTAVMYEPGKVLLVGGGGGSDTGPPPTATAEVIDLTAATPAWRRVASMETGRRQHNATVLPDGTVLVTGGSNAPGFNNQAGAVHTAELWDPATETWTTLASSTQYRGYHSTALLLPDGRVLSSGGDNHSNAEVYSPPYLFKGDRPTVAAAPAGVGYGQSFSVETPDAAGIAKVTMVRLSSVTHAFNQNQRFNSLSFTPVAGGLTVTAPANANLAPPGDYMLFLVNGDGVPSVAKIVRVGTAGVPAVAGVAVNGGAAQRSMVTTLTVTFDSLVTIAPGAFTLTRVGLPNGVPGDGATVGAITASTQTVNGVTVATLTFSGANVTAGSLDDGTWALTIDRTRVTSAGGSVPMAADFTGQVHRFFGDSEGDRDVDVLDLARFRPAYGKSAGQPGYAADFDSEGDGDVDVLDLSQFRQRYGRTI
jgi:hypothetical protein